MDQNRNNGAEAPGNVDVSVIIPCYNARGVLAACLDSILNHPPALRFEVIVVNDASTDGTPEMVRARFPSVRLLDNPRNLGYSRATNRGIGESRGRFVLLVNSDVEFLPGAIDRLASHLENHPEVGAAGTLLYNADGSIQPSVKALPSFRSALFGARSFIAHRWPENRFTRRELVHWKSAGGEPFTAGYISSASLMMPKQLLVDLGLLDPQFFHFVDSDLCKRVWNAGKSVVCVPAAGAMHDAHHGGSMASLSRRVRSVGMFHICAYRYFRKHSGTSFWHPMHAAVVAGLSCRFLVAAANQLMEEAFGLLRSREPRADTGPTPSATAAPAPGVPVVDVTMVIANYNSRAMLEACLTSVYAHPAASSVEVLVVDDASSDGSSDMVRRRFPEATLEANRRNLGYGGSCNLAIRRARGRYVYLLNNDVELLPGVVDRLVEFLDAHADAGAAGSLLFSSDGSVQWSVKAHPSLRSGIFGARSFLARWFPNNPFTRSELLHWKAEDGQPFAAGYVSSASLMVRREEFPRVGFLDTRLTYFNDADFCRRLWEAGRRVYYVPAARAIHHNHKGGTLVNLKRRFRSVVEFHLGAFRYFRRHGKTPAWHPLNALVAAGLFVRFVPSLLLQAGKDLALMPLVVLRRTKLARSVERA